MVFVTETNNNTVKVTLNALAKRTTNTNGTDFYKLTQPLRVPVGHIGIIKCETLHVKAPTILNTTLLNSTDNTLTLNGNATDAAGDSYLTKLITALTTMNTVNLQGTYDYLWLLVKILNSLDSLSWSVKIKAHNTTDGYITFLKAPVNDYVRKFAANTLASDETDTLSVGGEQLTSECIVFQVNGKWYQLWNTDKGYMESNAYYYLETLIARYDLTEVIWGGSTYGTATETTDITDADGNTTTYTVNSYTPDDDNGNVIVLSGKLLKIFNWYSPTSSTTVTLNNGETKTAVMKAEGYNVLNMHSNFTRAHYNTVSGSESMKRSDVLYSFPVTGTVGSDVFAEPNHTGLPFQDDLIEEIYIYFTDTFGDRVTVDFYQLVLAMTTEEQTQIEEPKPKRPKLELLSAIGGPTSTYQAY